MVRSFLLHPFAEAAQHAHYQATCATLVAEEGMLLLGNVVLKSQPSCVDAVVVQAHSITMLRLVPQGGQLHIPALRYGVWQLNGQPLPTVGADNPFACYQQQKQALAEWVGAQLGLPLASLPPIAGMVVFAGPVTFSAQVEQQLRQQSATDDFQLLADLAHLPRRLQQLPVSDKALNLAVLTQWAQRLGAQAAPLPPLSTEPTTLTSYWQQKAQQLWRWLGADDLPDDPSYTFPSQAEVARQREQLKQELQAEFRLQQQAQAHREAAWADSIAQLRQQLTQAATGPDHSEKATLEAALQTARAEAATRHQELDTRIQQLGQMIRQLQPMPAEAGASSTALPVVKSQVPKARPLPVQPRQRRQQLAATLLLVGSLAAGTWGMVWLAAPAAVAPQPAPAKVLPTLVASYSPAPAQSPTDTLNEYGNEEALADDSALYSTESVDDTASEQLPQAAPTSSQETPALEVEPIASPTLDHSDPDLNEPDSTLEVLTEPGLLP